MNFSALSTLFQLWLGQHGALALFLATLAERLGLPVVTTPLLVAAGASHAHTLPLLLAACLLACLLGDALWYELGRRHGAALLGIFCRLCLQSPNALEPLAASLRRRPVLVLLTAKWLPGVAHLVVPLSGVARLPRRRFHLLNACGAILWAAPLLIIGRLGTLPATTLIATSLLVLAAGSVLAVLLGAPFAVLADERKARRAQLAALRTLHPVTPPAEHSGMLEEVTTPAHAHAHL